MKDSTGLALRTVLVGWIIGMNTAREWVPWLGTVLLGVIGVWYVLIDWKDRN